MLRRRWDGTAWAGAEDIGASSHRVPAAASRTPTTVDLVLGRPAPDLGAPLHRSWDGAAWQDENLDGTLDSDPALIAPAADRLELFQNLSGRLYRKVFDGAWQPWENVDAALARKDPKIQGAPTACAPAPGIVDVYAVRHDTAGVWFRRFAAGAWSAWEALPDDELQPDALQFDAEWEWIGSHPTFRSATFVRLYPDNLLLPSLAPRQTPAFSKLLAQTRPTQRITPEKACSLASAYAAYLQDISWLRVQASCHVVAAVASPDPCQAAAPTRRALELMFACAPSGRVYWSSFDPPPWTPVIPSRSGRRFRWAAAKAPRRSSRSTGSSPRCRGSAKRPASTTSTFSSRPIGRPGTRSSAPAWTSNVTTATTRGRATPRKWTFRPPRRPPSSLCSLTITPRRPGWPSTSPRH